MIINKELINHAFAVYGETIRRNLKNNKHDDETLKSEINLRKSLTKKIYNMQFERTRNGSD